MCSPIFVECNFLRFFRGFLVTPSWDNHFLNKLERVMNNEDGLIFQPVNSVGRDVQSMALPSLLIYAFLVDTVGGRDQDDFGGCGRLSGDR